MREQKAEAASDSDDAFSSLQELVRSLSDTTDAKLRAETEANMLQVQMKSMQKDLDAHRFELNVVRKQLQLRTEDTEQHRRESDATYRQHLENVRKIARLEAECHRLRSLIRHRLPGPAMVSQMRAECDIHVQMTVEKSSRSAMLQKSPSNIRHTTSRCLGAEREIETLKERLLSVEDEAKVLKEALAQRTAELEEARQLGARTAMKLSAAQACIKSMASKVCPAPGCGTLQQQSLLLDVDHSHDLPKDFTSSLTANKLINPENSLDESCKIFKNTEPTTLWLKSEQENVNHTSDGGELDESSCAESWASALVAELSHLSNRHEGGFSPVRYASFMDKQNLPNVETSKFKATNLSFHKASLEGLDLYEGLEMVRQKLFSVGGTLFESLSDELNSSNKTETSSCSGEGLCCTQHRKCSSLAHGNRTHAEMMLDEIVQIKSLLAEISRATEMSNESFDKTLCSAKFGERACHGGKLGEHAGQKWASCGARKRGLSRLRINSLETAEGVSAGLMGEETVGKSGDESDGGDKLGERLDGRGECLDRAMGSENREEIAETDFGRDEQESAIASEDEAKHADVDEGLEALEPPPEARTELAHARAALEAELAPCSLREADVAFGPRANDAENQSPDAELASTAASVDVLERQLLPSTPDASPHGAGSLAQDNLCDSATLDLHSSSLEEEELVVARAQDVESQDCNGDISQQLLKQIGSSTIQDVVIDDKKSSKLALEPLRSKKENISFLQSKSNGLLNCNMPTVDFVKSQPLDNNLMAQELCSETIGSFLVVSNSSHEAKISSSFTKIDIEATNQYIEPCKAHIVPVKPKPFRHLTRSLSSEHAIKSSRSLSKAPKLSATFRILELFSKSRYPVGKRS